ncbi:MAG: hypothetical protein ABR535_03510 [Pyrinomonadaceae bacterium]
MRVKCITNRIADIRTVELSEHLDARIRGLEWLDGLEVGKEYMVYGLVFWQSIPYFYICEEDADEYPVPNFAGFFSVTDNRLSSEFRLVWYLDDISQSYLVPKEWAEDRLFYPRLLDGYYAEIETFKRIKSRIDDEFARQ